MMSPEAERYIYQQCFDYLLTSECDPQQLQAAHELGSLSQKKRTVLGDITNRPDQTAALQSPSMNRTKAVIKQSQLGTINDQDRWLSYQFPEELSLMESLQKTSHHVFEISDRQLNHLGAMSLGSTEPVRKQTAMKKTIFRFVNPI